MTDVGDMSETLSVSQCTTEHDVAMLKKRESLRSRGRMIGKDFANLLSFPRCSSSLQYNFVSFYILMIWEICPGVPLLLGI